MGNKNQKMKKKIIILYDFLKEVGGLERVMFFQANNLDSKFETEIVFSYIDNKKVELKLGELKGNNIKSNIVPNGF